jgi:ABC-type multidrug transport system ATPase subunit
MRIVIENLNVRRGGYPAVAKVSLEIGAGQWTGLIGANGSGKTSLLRGIAGRAGVHGGAILIDGTDRTTERAWRAGAIGFAADAAALPPSLTGRELFAIIASDTPGLGEDDALAPLRAALDFDRFIDQRIGALSTGMRQRLAIFAAFLTRAGAVFLDEPFNWLDPICAFDTKAALRGLVATHGLTLFTALHDTATLIDHCDAGILLAEGRVARCIGRDDLAASRRDHAGFEAAIVRSLRANGGVGQPRVAIVSPGASA